MIGDCVHGFTAPWGYCREAEIAPASGDPLRSQFEQLAFQAYLDRRAKGGLSNDLPADEAVSPEQLFWTQPDGSYGVLTFNQAWWGFQAGYELAGVVRS